MNLIFNFDFKYSFSIIVIIPKILPGSQQICPKVNTIQYCRFLTEHRCEKTFHALKTLTMAK